MLKLYVNRVLIDAKSKRAWGVEYLYKGRMIRAFAKKEVIVSAGTINTPKILMLSGVGPAKHLQDLSIQVIKDLPVGQNLQVSNVFHFQHFFHSR